jgi:hypothetical protein
VDYLDLLLDELGPGSYEEVGDWAARLLSATYLLNQRLEQLEQVEKLEEERKRRLEKWLKRLFESAKQAADQYEAVGFSIAVGIPAGVTVTVDWKTSNG